MGSLLRRNGSMRLVYGSVFHAHDNERMGRGVDVMIYSIETRNLDIHS